MTVKALPAGASAATYRFSFVRWRHLAFSLSALTLAVTVALLVWRGLALGLDFTGGLAVEAERAQPFQLFDLRAALAHSGLADATIQLSENGHRALIRVQDSAGAGIEAVRVAIGDGARVLGFDSLGPKVSGELLRSGLLSCLAAVGVIALYVWMRFEARFGLSALLTTFHDVALMVGFFAVTGITFDLTSVAALLLIAGYSINDTVVVFDRLREVLGKHRSLPLPAAIDLAITSTLRRTLMTSATTLVTSVALMIFGGPVLFGFAAATTFGLVLGTLSSIFVAAPLLLVLPGRLPGQGEPAEPEPAP